MLYDVGGLHGRLLGMPVRRLAEPGKILYPACKYLKPMREGLIYRCLASKWPVLHSVTSQLVKGDVVSYLCQQGLSLHTSRLEGDGGLAA
jgi:hypothetical protein